MTVQHTKRVTSVSGRIGLSLLCLWPLVFGAASISTTFAQGRFTEVLVSEVKGKLVAVTGAGQSEIELSVGETIVSTKAQGLTALAVTSARVLGFSSQLRHWGEQALDANEQVRSSHVLRELCIVGTDRHLYGFQGALAHWTSEALGVSEHIQEVRASGHLAVAVTTERLLGFSAYMSEFSALSFSGEERVTSMEHAGDSFVVKTNRRTVMFRSRVPGWTELG